LIGTFHRPEYSPFSRRQVRAGFAPKEYLMVALRAVFGAAAVGVIAVAGIVYWEWDELVPVAGLG